MNPLVYLLYGPVPAVFFVAFLQPRLNLTVNGSCDTICVLSTARRRKMAKLKTAQDITCDILKDESRVVDFISPVLQTKQKYEMIKEDARSDKTAKAYLEQVEQQYRLQLKFLYEAAKTAYPEDRLNPSHAMSSIGPDSILTDYDFKVIVSKK